MDYIPYVVFFIRDLVPYDLAEAVRIGLELKDELQPIFYFKRALRGRKWP